MNDQISSTDEAIPPKNWKWCWPNVGAAPLNQSLDAETFDGDRVPLSETIVREALQNSLDARLDKHHSPVHLKISFHEETKGPQVAFLTEAINHRKQLGLTVPNDWNHGYVSWMNIEDYSSSGLCGSISRRDSDFWNYWLNFGLSNKVGKARGGRGIGRITFLIASNISAVLGYTKRNEDEETHACGMVVLKASPNGDFFRSTHAYLAASEQHSVYRLHSSHKFKDGIKKAFRLRKPPKGSSDSGLSLIVPYPHESLIPEKIKASIIENFAPAILGGHLVAHVANSTIDRDSLPSVANSISAHFNDPSIAKDPNRFIRLLLASVDDRIQCFKFSIPKADRRLICELDSTSSFQSLQHRLENLEYARASLSFPLRQYKKDNPVSVNFTINPTPAGSAAIDLFFREGMCLPLVKSKSARGYDSITTVEDTLLSDYLNLCEGKAHLDLLENADVKEKLKHKGFRVSEKRLIAALSEEIRRLLAPEVTEPDASVFSDLFSLPTPPSEPSGRPTGGSNPGRTGPTVTPPPRKIQAFSLSSIDGGFSVQATDEFNDWPTSLVIQLAYEDGTRKPAWSRFDFVLDELEITAHGCDEFWTKENRLNVPFCESNFRMKVTGFDRNRELRVMLRRAKNPTMNS